MTLAFGALAASQAQVGAPAEPAGQAAAAQCAVPDANLAPAPAPLPATAVEAEPVARAGIPPMDVAAPAAADTETAIFALG
jgi:hypothetical protein